MANVTIETQAYIEVELHDGPVKYPTKLDPQVADSLLTLIRSAVLRKKDTWWRDYDPICLRNDPRKVYNIEFKHEIKAAEALGINPIQAWQLLEDLTDKRWE